MTNQGIAIARPAVGEKGYMDVSIEVKTPGGHSSVPPEHTVSVDPLNMDLSHLDFVVSRLVSSLASL